MRSGVGRDNDCTCEPPTHPANTDRRGRCRGCGAAIPWDSTTTSESASALGGKLREAMEPEVLQEVEPQLDLDLDRHRN